MYANGIHQDFGVGDKEYEHNVACYNEESGREFRNYYDKEDVKGMSAVVLWRPILMDGPCTHKPLVVCDATSVKMDDVIPTALVGFLPDGK